MDPKSQKTEPELYPAELGYLPPEFVRKAELELSETPQRKEAAVNEVRKLMRQDASMKEEWFSDDNIVMYLRCKKYDVHRAFSSMKKTVAIIKKHAKIFDRVNLEELAKNMEEDIFRFFPYRDKDGCVIILSKLSKWDPSALDFEKAIVYLTMVLWHALSDPMSQVNGVRLIYDFKVPLLKYLKYNTPLKTYFLYQLCVETVPMRVKFFHGVNPNGMSKIFIPTFLAFAPEKIRSRVKLHSDTAELLDHLPAKVVPNEYGGQLTHEGRMCSWSKKIKIPDYVENILKSVKSSS